MGTRSSIAVKMSDNKVKTIYCHWDGYPSHNGKMLKGFYNSQEMAESLVNLGDMSILDESIEKPDGHTFDKRVEGYSTFYGRDRGETGVDAKEFDTYDKALKFNNHNYNYYWDGEKWLVDGEVLTDEIINND